MIRFLIRSRYVTFLSTVAILITLVLYGVHVRYEQSLQSFFSENDPVVIDYQRASYLFGNDNLVFITYDDPELLTAAGIDRLADLVRSLKERKIPAVVGLQSLDAMPQFWRIDDELVRLTALPAFLKNGAKTLLRTAARNLDPSAVGSLSVGSAIRSATADELPKLQQVITRHPLLEGTVVSSTGRCTSVVVQLTGMGEQEPRETIAALRDTADRFASRHGLDRPALVGPPVLLADGFEAIDKDGRRLSIVGMALIGFVTLVATRSLWWSIVPILSGWTVWLATEHTLGVLGLRLSLSGGPLVAQIIVLTMPAASHLAIHFRDDLRRRFDRQGAAVETIRCVFSPIAWTALTGAIGYGALLSSNVVPVRQFGAILAACTLCAAFLTLVLSPTAMRPPFRLELPIRPGSSTRLDVFLDRATRLVTQRPLVIVLAVLFVVVPSSLGMPRLRFETNYINAFKPDARVVHDYHMVEERLGGIGLVSLVFPVQDALTVETMTAIRRLDERVDSIGQEASGVGTVSRIISLATVLDPEGKLASLAPDRFREALELKLEVIASSTQAGLMDSFWAPELGWARTVVRIPEQQPAIAKLASFREAEAVTRATFGEEAYLTGMSYLLTQTTRGVMTTQWTAFAWALGGILLMLSLAFRRVSLAFLAVLPSLLAVGLVLGIMGWREMKLDLATALIASVALGLSVDDTFHCLLQYRRHRRQGGTFNSSLLASYSVTGPGVLLSSLAVGIGFVVLRFSEFVPFSNFGTMVAIATLGSSLGNLALLPACLALGHRMASHGSGSKIKTSFEENAKNLAITSEHSGSTIESGIKTESHRKPRRTSGLETGSDL